MAWDETVARVTGAFAMRQAEGARAFGDPARRRRGQVALSLLAMLALAGCSDPTRLFSPPSPSQVVEEDAGQPLPDAGSIVSTTLRLTYVDADHGPFVGGNVVTLRGTGFAEGITVTFDGLQVSPADIEVVDGSRVNVVVPAGEPGPADVAVELEGVSAVLLGGYEYQQVYVDPGSGSVAGNTFVRIIGSGTDFAEGGGVDFGLLACENITVVSTTEITCYTPPGSVGTVAVTYISPPDDDGLSESLRTEDAYLYYDASSGGGLSGGELAGALNVTVINSSTGAGVAGAWVVVGDDPSGELRGQTDSFGRVTLSAEDLAAPLDIHVAAECYANTTFRAFDARDVTILAEYICSDSGDPPSSVSPTAPSVAGELIFTGPNEYGPNPWDAYVPEERTGWTRVAYVMTTMACADETSTACMNPPPGAGVGSKWRVLETEADQGELGYTYRILTNIGAMSLFAMAGLENDTTGEFRPYVMGVARGVLTASGAEVLGVNITMNIPLDHQLGVQVTNLPGQTLYGYPDEFRVTADVDLGGEGLIVRLDPLSDWSAYPYTLLRIDEVTRANALRPFNFPGVPALTGALADGRFRALVQWSGGGVESNRVITGIRDADATVVVDDMLGIPELDVSDPSVLRWDYTGGPQPDFFYVLIVEIGLTQTTRWVHFLPGTESQTTLPSLELLEGVDPLPADALLVALVVAVELPGSSFNSFSYGDLSSSRWTAWSTDQAVLNL